MGGCCSCCSWEEEAFELSVAPTHVELSEDNRGKEVRVSNGRVSGNGTVFANAAVHQDAAYWEIKVLKNGGRIVWGISREVERDALNGALCVRGGSDSACVLDSANLDPTSNPDRDPEEETPNSGLMVLNESDVLGVHVQQSDLPMVQFYCNGQEIPNTAVNRFRGLMYPVVSVMGGATVEVCSCASLYASCVAFFFGILANRFPLAPRRDQGALRRRPLGVSAKVQESAAHDESRRADLKLVDRNELMAFTLEEPRSELKALS
eukprot:scaffold145_cov261-Pinguiococcus_pyrenoidosus.AAC.29